MKKTILFAWIASLVLILGGCGSNDKVDTGGSAGATDKVVTLSPAPLIPTGDTNFEIHIPVTKTVSSKYTVTMKDFKLLSVEGCEIDRINVPNSLKLKGNVGSSETLDISGNFKNSCTPGKYVRV